MSRIDEIAREVREHLGESGPGPSNARLLADLDRRRRSRVRGLRLSAAAVLLLLGGGAVLLLAGSPEPVVAPESVVTAAIIEPPLTTDPMAAMLLESAKLRLEGYGDPEVARSTLREVLDTYPSTRSARRAGELLARMEGDDR